MGDSERAQPDGGCSVWAPRRVRRARCDQPMIQQTNGWRIGMGAALMLFALMAVFLTIMSERPGNEIIAEGFGAFIDFKG